MECACGVEIEAWREQCDDCDLAEVMGSAPAARGKRLCSGMAVRPALRSKLPSKWGGDLELYVLRWKKRGLVKIGATSNLDRRRADLERLAGEPLELVAHVPLSNVGAEIGFHADMAGASDKMSGEWYHWTPRMETLVERLKLAPQAT